MSSPRVQAIRYWSFGDVTRIAIQTEGAYKLTSDQIENPWRLYFDLNGLRPPATVHHAIETIEVGDHRVKQIRVAEVSPGKTRIVFDLQGPVEVVSSQLVNPDRLMIEIRPKTPSSSVVATTPTTTESRRVNLSEDHSPAPEPSLPGKTPMSTGPVHRPETAATPSMATAPSRSDVTPHATLPTPVPQDVHSGQTDVAAPTAVAPEPVASNRAAAEATASIRTPSTTTPEAPAARPVHVAGPATAAVKDSSGDRSLVRVFGLKLGKVVIDAGHGGHDTGTIGPNGLMEKDLVLDVALRLGKMITRQLGAEVIYTRSSDVFIPLEDRTKIAEDQKADLFISIHANSSPEPTATGVETYYFNLNSDRSGLDLATRENATATSSISDLNDLLHRAVLQTKLEESREFAQTVQTSLWSASVKMNSRSRDRGVRHAPFVVLIGATMPSILAEIGFVSNPHDERLMKRSDQRQRIAQALFKGISQYASSLSHTQLARAGGE